MRISRVTVFFLILILTGFMYPFALSDFGESSPSLGQFTDDFIDLNNVSVKVLIVRNATLNAMELNASEALRKNYENFELPVWVEQDALNRLSVNSLRVNFTSELRTDNNIHLSRDFGAGAWDNLSVEFDFYVDSIALTAGQVFRMFLITFSERADDAFGVETANQEMVGVRINGLNDISPDFRIGLHEYSDGVSNGVGSVQLSQNVVYYGVFNKTDDEADVLIYNDPARTAGFLVGQVGLTLSKDWTFQYILVSQSWDLSSGTHQTTGFIENLLLEGNITGGFDTSGYFTTENYLNYANGSALVQLTNATIPKKTGIKIQFSQDNSTWVNNLNSPGANAVTAGFQSIDLRELNWSSSYFLRYNFTGTRTATPRLYQSRLITTRGPAGVAGPGAPGFNVSGVWTLFNVTEINATVGTVDGGNVNSTLDIDGDTFNVSETTGDPAFVISFNFTGVPQTADCIWVLINSFYTGNQRHDLTVQLYNFSAPGWAVIGLISDATGFEWVNSSIYALRIPNDFVDSSGSVLGRIFHAAPGNINHDILIDYLKIIAKIPAGPTPGAGIVNIIESDFPWIAIAIILMLVAYLLLSRLR